MIAPRLLLPAVLMISGTALPARSQAPAPSRLKVAQEPKPIELTVSPRAAGLPAFQHRLFPLGSERTPGDAAPIYLRLHGEFTDGMRQLTNGKATEWLALPLDKLPVAEARAFVDRFAGKVEQIRFGSRRRTCDWNYTLPEERERGYAILLPDAQEMRQWGRLLALKARVEIAEGRTDDAVGSIETGLAFSRHVGEGPFIINGLIGVALASGMLQQVDELVARPDAPNLYWALTALPRPLVDFRAASENEIKLVEWVFPELAEIGRPASPAEWSALLGRLHARMAESAGASGWLDAEERKAIRVEPDLARFRASLLPEAREHLKARSIPAEGKPDDQVAMLYLAGLPAEIRDELARPYYLPFSESGPLLADASRLRARHKDGPLGLFVSLLPLGEEGIAAEARLDRKVAALRVVEAVRMQAAADGGKVPDSLAAVTVVPVPADPMTGRPFDYRREGDAVIVGSALPGDDRLAYRLAFRK